MMGFDNDNVIHLSLGPSYYLAWSGLAFNEKPSPECLYGCKLDQLNYLVCSRSYVQLSFTHTYLLAQGRKLIFFTLRVAEH